MNLRYQKTNLQHWSENYLYFLECTRASILGTVAEQRGCCEGETLLNSDTVQTNIPEGRIKEQGDLDEECFHSLILDHRTKNFLFNGIWAFQAHCVLQMLPMAAVAPKRVKNTCDCFQVSIRRRLLPFLPRSLHCQCFVTVPDKTIKVILKEKD